MSSGSTAGKTVLESFSDALADAVEQAGAALVLVNARRRLPGSGIGYAPDLVLTADHIIEREEDISVMLPDGSEVAASVAGRDPGSDLALLRLERPAASVARQAAQEARVGQFVLALGRPTGEGVQASLGVISAAGGPLRTGRGGLLERYLRSDAVPYPGFSGGPLVDATGAVVGINTSGLGLGTALAIPVALAWQVAATLAQHGRIRRGYLGIRSQPTPLPAALQQTLGREQAAGLLLLWVEEGSPAAQAGLLVGDILVALSGQPVTDPDELQAVLAISSAGQSTEAELLRGGQRTTLPVSIGERR